ncbi:MAG: class I tRNA ligase family protein, partial [Rhabdaerophilum sp.]
GQLSNRKLEEQEAGARVAVEAHKRNPGDFVLWKQSSADQPGWEASFAGVPIFGRPGWHIECSAMSMAKLLEPFGGGLACDDPQKNTFDIHGGGIDLVFPHHENEIAQSCCAFGAPGQPNPLMASIWMHNGFLQVEGQKMSKSLGNFTTIADVLKDWPGEVARLTMLKTHYRQPIDWTVKSLEESQSILNSWANATAGSVESQPSDLFIAAIADDLNSSEAIAELHRLAKNDPSALKASAALIGLDLSQASQVQTSDSERAVITSLINLRLAARAAKNFAESDRIRDELAAMGIQLNDGKDENGNPVTTWEVKR